MKPSLLFALVLSLLGSLYAEKPNILIITVDDMSCDSIGAFGCPVPDTSPHVDALAAEGVRFTRAHVQVGNCYPSRNVMWSGKFPHVTGIEGFFEVKPIGFPVMCDLMKEAGYYTAIRGKVSHSTPYQPYDWDADLTIAPDGTTYHMKDVESYYTSTQTGIASAQESGKPFCLNINISDPHKPFWKPNDPHAASKIFTAEDVVVPGFLVDDPVVRQELGLYYTSVRRADDAVGAILRALDESGLSEETVVMFLSDHGMPLPFAKTQLWHHSTNTPWIVRWPGVTQPGSTDDHMISAVDMLPTLLDIIGAEKPDTTFNGKSFINLIKGEAPADPDYRQFVVKEYNENSAKTRNPMRAIQSENFLYLFNPWSNGERDMKTATRGTATYRRMLELAKSDPAVAERVRLLDYRELEEFYDIENDPDCLVNLVGNKDYADQLAQHRDWLENWLKQTNDTVLYPFENRENKDLVEKWMEGEEAKSAERRSKGKNKKKQNKGKKGK